MQRVTETSPKIISVMKFDFPRFTMRIGSVQMRMTKALRMMPATNSEVFSAVANALGNSSIKMLDVIMLSR